MNWTVNNEFKKAFNELCEMDENIYKLSKKRVSRAKPKYISVIIADIIFCTAVFLIFICILTINIRQDKIKSFFGYSYFTVISDSMKYEIPKGSLIFVKHTKDLKLGDNITFKTRDNTLVTHKIIDIYETGEFKTQGINNTDPDDFLVHESDIIGKVTQTIPVIGILLLSINEKMPLVFVMLSLFIIIYFLYFREVTSEKEN